MEFFRKSMFCKCDTERKGKHPFKGKHLRRYNHKPPIREPTQKNKDETPKDKDEEPKLDYSKAGFDRMVRLRKHYQNIEPVWHTEVSWDSTKNWKVGEHH